jgi:hypothetical protein
MSLLSRLFGGGKTAEAAPEFETYAGMRIYAEPQREGSDYRLCARIEQDVDGETREQLVIRADTFGSADDAAKASVTKAKQVIDEQGENLFS